MTTRPGLLDVNVLISLIDPAHRFHEAAHSWFAGSQRFGWATSPITENGCIRIMSHAGYPCPGLTAEKVGAILAELTKLRGHRFWADSVSLADAHRVNLSGVNSKQVTDLYLLASAVAQKGKLVTFDRAIPWNAVAGCAREHMEILVA